VATPAEVVASMRENAHVANGGTGILTAEATPETARRTWPQWLALGVAMIAVAVAAVLSDAAGARLLLGALGLFLVLRGAVLLRAARTRGLDRNLAPRARSLGTAALAGGAAALVVGVASPGLSAAVLLVGVPVLLMAAAGVLLAREGRTARRGGQALLLWSVLVTALLAVTGVAQGWDRAADVATVVSALALAVLGVPLLVAAAHLRTIAARPVPAAPAGCGGCACGAGGCGS
jgi:uncharacterized membrane protein HdeD (DUF308 family)